MYTVVLVIFLFSIVFSLAIAALTSKTRSTKMQLVLKVTGSLLMVLSIVGIGGYIYTLTLVQSSPVYTVSNNNPYASPEQINQPVNQYDTPQHDQYNVNISENIFEGFALANSDDF